MTWKDTLFGRTARRFMAVFVCGGIASLIAYFGNLTEPQLLIYAPIVTAILTALDKAIREWGGIPKQ